MPSPNVDIVFVIDASRSMKRCYVELCKHLDQVIRPLQGNAATINYGFVAQSVGSEDGNAVFSIDFLGGGTEVFDELYRAGAGTISRLFQRQHSISRDSFFTQDPDRFTTALAAIKPKGDEEMLIALDIAADFPFGPLADTKRVIALFSDEAFEASQSRGKAGDKLPALCDKLQSRHIQLFAAIPDGPTAQLLAAVDRSEIELIDAGGGMKNVDFSKLLGQMGKSISVSAVQGIGEGAFEKGLYGQASWTTSVEGKFTRDSR